MDLETRGAKGTDRRPHGIDRQDRHSERYGGHGRVGLKPGLDALSSPKGKTQQKEGRKEIAKPPNAQRNASDLAVSSVDDIVAIEDLIDVAGKIRFAFGFYVEVVVDRIYRHQAAEDGQDDADCDPDRCSGRSFRFR